ncbi:LOW QUALITY PROTEIN: NHL repeat-containing protein 3 [Oxyura jamaicensis]|uniref:LOW QUALITY PROTEIN: NHL repeat-containing protein 3 n=1 Tax=Oxyura jamaicensis TaxID=8884 RepID=UPI0015A50E09|nr:LOW QUALITY PROTEIN: NHL repeat-containing protein 3 [Oxyura jamaicensis]
MTPKGPHRAPLLGAARPPRCLRRSSTPEAVPQLSRLPRNATRSAEASSRAPLHPPLTPAGPAPFWAARRHVVGGRCLGTERVSRGCHGNAGPGASMRGKRPLGPWLVMASALLVLLGLLGGSQVLKAFDYFYPSKGQQQMYKLDISWPKIPEYFTGQTFCVAVDSLHGLVYVGQRGDNVPKVLVFSEEGYFLYSWNDTVEMPHGIFVLNTATDSSVWITDVGTGKYGHTVKQYSPSGKLLQILGTPGNAGSSLNPIQFDQPAEIFVEESGDMYVVDGDGGMNNRLLKLSTDYKEIWLSGENGTGIGQFKIPHSVTVDPYGRVWVADRDNRRIQVFDKVTGEWLGAWSSCFSEDGPYSVRFTADYKYLIVAQMNINRLAILAAPPVGIIGDCAIVNAIQLADETKPHLVDIDMKRGAIYIAEIGAQQVQKYVPVS